METGKRPIGKSFAKKLADFFHTNYKSFFYKKVKKIGIGLIQINPMPNPHFFILHAHILMHKNELST